MAGHPEHDLNDPHCTIEEAMGWGHPGPDYPDFSAMTPQQEEVFGRAYRQLEEISGNYQRGAPARNAAERRLYAEMDRGRERVAELNEAIDAFQAELDGDREAGA